MNTLLEIALNEYGTKEIAGEAHEKRILQYARDLGMQFIQDDETAWCSVFINWCALQCGFERTNRANARSWLQVGKVIEEPQLGDVVVFWRESPASWKGHVAIVIRVTDEFVYALGGNQDNQVKISCYNKSTVLGYRRLHKL